MFKSKTLKNTINFVIIEKIFLKIFRREFAFSSRRNIDNKLQIAIQSKCLE